MQNNNEGTIEFKKPEETTIKKILDKIYSDAFKYQTKNGFDTYFDFLFEDLGEIEKLIEKLK